MTKYPALEEVRSNLTVTWYRTKLESAVLRDLTRRSNARGLGQALGHLLLYLCTGTLTFWLWSAQIWAGFAVALFAHGTVATFMRGTATHELGHGTVFRTKWLNRVFLNVFSLLGWWNHVDYAISHTYHHRYTLHPEADRENILPLSPAPGFFGWIQLFTINIFTRAGRTFSSGGFLSTVAKYFRIALGLRPRSSAPSIEWLDALHRDQPREARKSAWWCRLTIVFHAAVVAASLITGLWVLPILVTLASFIANVAGYAVGLTQHCGLKDNNSDFRKCTRSIRLGPVLSYLYWRMHWHLEHHMYAAVPCYNLGKLARLIADDVPAPNSLRGAWSEMRATWRTQQEDPSYQRELELPPTAAPWPAETGKSGGDTSRGSDETDEQLTGSIGDLAPEGLN